LITLITFDETGNSIIISQIISTYWQQWIKTRPTVTSVNSVTKV